MPVSSRFPLPPAAGRIPSNSAVPSGVRPLGMRFAVEPVPIVEAGQHSKKPTNMTRAEQTQVIDDGQVVGYRSDTVHYVEMDEE